MLQVYSLPQQQPNTQRTQRITSPCARDGDQQEHHFAVVRLQQHQQLLHWSGTFVPVIEEKLDTITRAQEGYGEGKERRSIGEDLR